jgi:hypothetical protein
MTFLFLTTCLALAALPASNKVETDTYTIEMGSREPYRAGATSYVTVTLITKGAFHINPQYPYRFKTATPSARISYPHPVLERADGQFQERSAVFQVPFVASTAGQAEIGGTFNLSVCSPDACIIKKAPLALLVNVK